MCSACWADICHQGREALSFIERLDWAGFRCEISGGFGIFNIRQERILKNSPSCYLLFNYNTILVGLISSKTRKIN